MNVALVELEPVFICRKVEQVPCDQWIDGRMYPSGEAVSHEPITELERADGIMFRCPKCRDGNGHSVICWFEGKVADDVQPGPGRWNPKGTGFADLSFVPGAKSCSIQLLGGCNAHFFITNGRVHE